VFSRAGNTAGARPVIAGGCSHACGKKKSKNYFCLGFVWGLARGRKPPDFMPDKFRLNVRGLRLIGDFLALFYRGRVAKKGGLF
jgi:hypothetical protein